MHTHFNLAKLHLALLPTHQLIWTLNEVHEGLGRRSHFSPPGSSNIEANHFTLWRTMEKRVRDVRKLIDGATIFVSVVTNLQHKVKGKNQVLLLGAWSGGPPTRSIAHDCSRMLALSTQIFCPF